MSFPSEITRVIELFQLPFMQRAFIGGILTGIMGGLLGSFTILRQLSFFSDALGHSALLGISIGFLLGLNSSVVLLPFSVIFALAVSYLLERTRLWTDALLNIIYSSSLAIAIITLSFVGQYKGGLNNLLFGDILAVQELDLVFSAVLLIICIVLLGLTLRTQMLLTLHEPLAIARGIPVSTHRTVFIVLLSLVVGISIKAIGVLLVSAFVVIPACAARLLSRTFTSYVLLSAAIGAVSAVLGMVVSAWFNLPSGPSIVTTQLTIFIVAMTLPRFNSLAH
ncbi:MULTISPECIES: metal ABC transporter permease [Planktothrix]|jgi:zinc/manganese transport system permease protein|uniref:ABC-3 protein n=2 Tax=Planktothrix TaxID=54304 RepID=A0A4P5ZTB3_PLAAG|nr:MULTISPECIES: metal ABC transporter permease [Planktothrix]CAD5974065.1 putative membrane protein in ycf23-apcF intergenic region [Planktothrix rubescens]CAC5342536.1 ABC-type Mn2+/Zn2+ transport system, permease component [Planktothrix rubescens NIVA-CYA 18]CAD0223697.1 ABC-3 protein [Planktothrix agardhii]CAD5971124.1 putative membrane protein in ycf23-apcF intergenic region [Planktothrix rubescens NIVA-CYA 18]CAH2574335.1 putative membrane protein in ycf23-apcF intergenic region [Plankto